MDNNVRVNVEATFVPHERYEALIASERDAQLLKKILLQKADANEAIYASEVKSLVGIFCGETQKDGDTE